MGRLARAATGRLVWLTQRIAPRLERRYAKLPSSAGLAPGMDLRRQEARLLSYLAALRTRVAELPDRPSFSLLLSLDDPDPDWLAECLFAVAQQLHPEWELVVSGDGAESSLADFRRDHPGRVTVAPAAPTDAERLNNCLAKASGDYVIRIGQDDRLTPQALAEVVRHLDLAVRLGRPRPEVVYSDERDLTSDGTPAGEPLFKPGWSPLLLLSGPYTGDLVAVARPLVQRMQGFDAAVQPAHLHDWVLRATGLQPDAVIHVPEVLYQRRRVEPPAADPHATRAVIERAGLRLDRPIITGPLHPDRAVVRFQPPTTWPSVSVIIPTRNEAEHLGRCHSSILTSTYPDVQIVIVDNGSDEPAALALLSRLAEEPGTIVLRQPGPFNFASLCMTGVEESTGEYLVLLNNDTEVVTPGWLEALIEVAALPGVAAVGPQLRYPNGTIQHAGIVGLAESGTGHEFLARRPDSPTPVDLLQRIHEVLAVTGACLAISRERFLAVGGLDEYVVPNDSGDIDLCLRLRASGLVNVYTPHAVLLHSESRSRGRSFVNFERRYLLQRWGDQLLRDPYLNPNLAKTTRFDPDYRFPAADIPGSSFRSWFVAGAIPLPPRH